MEAYARNIVSGGVLFLSGFFEDDVHILEKECRKFGFETDKVKTKDKWAAMRLVKVKK